MRPIFVSGGGTTCRSKAQPGLIERGGSTASTTTTTEYWVLGSLKRRLHNGGPVRCSSTKCRDHQEEKDQSWHLHGLGPGGLWMGMGWRRFEVGEDKPGRGGLAGLVHAGKHEANMSGASTGVKRQASGVRREAVVKVNVIPEPELLKHQDMEEEDWSGDLESRSMNG